MTQPITAPAVTGSSPAATRAYLTNVAETLASVVLPELQGKARARGFDCLRVIARLAAHCSPSQEALAPLAAAPATALEAALNEGKVIDNVDAEARQLLGTMTSTPPAAVRKFDADALQAFLRSHPRGGDRLRITECNLLSGGRSKLTALVSQSAATDLPETFIVRQDWSASIVAGSVVTEFRVLDKLHEAGIKVPRPLLFKPAKDEAGNPFIVVERSPGRTSGDNQHVLPPSEAPVLQLAGQLGRFHALEADQFTALPGIVERNYTSQQIAATLDSYAAVLGTLDDSRSLLAQEVLAWLRKHRERAGTGPRSLVHGDLGFHNCLCDGDDLTVILDWELAHVGCAAYDLGYLRNAIVDAGLWSRFMKNYELGGGPKVDPFLIDYFHLFTCLWFYQLVLQAKAALVAGVLHDVEIVAACTDILPKSLSVMARSFARCAV